MYIYIVNWNSQPQICSTWSGKSLMCRFDYFKLERVQHISVIFWESFSITHAISHSTEPHLSVSANIIFILHCGILPNKDKKTEGYWTIQYITVGSKLCFVNDVLLLFWTYKLSDICWRNVETCHSLVNERCIFVCLCIHHAFFFCLQRT